MQANWNNEKRTPKRVLFYWIESIQSCFWQKKKAVALDATAFLGLM